ncbi:MAG: hypothetical protein IKS17_09780 [Firmicutes bacterium]|nr:hypothetical protein [Bacillota bacterium]
MDDKFLQNEILNELEPQQASAIRALYNRIKGKQPSEILPIIMAFKMPEGRPLSPEKKQRLIAAAMEELNIK